jgi:hypothetical protein
MDIPFNSFETSYKFRITFHGQTQNVSKPQIRYDNKNLTSSEQYKNRSHKKYMKS